MCASSLSYGLQRNAHAPIVALIARIAVIAGDVLVLAVTWAKTARAYKEARRLNIRAPLATTLLHEGELICAYEASPSYNFVFIWQECYSSCMSHQLASCNDPRSEPSTA